MQQNILSTYYKLQPYMQNIELTTLYTTMHRENFFVDPAIYSDHVDDDAPCRTITEVDGWVVVDWNAVCANGNINKQLFSRGKHAHRAVVGLRQQRYAFIAYFRIKKKTISHGLLSVNFRESDPSLAIYQGVRRVSPLSLRGSDNHPCRACNYW